MVPENVNATKYNTLGASLIGMIYWDEIHLIGIWNIFENALFAYKYLKYCYPLQMDEHRVKHSLIKHVSRITYQLITYGNRSQKQLQNVQILWKKRRVDEYKGRAYKCMWLTLQHYGSQKLKLSRK